MELAFGRSSDDWHGLLAFFIDNIYSTFYHKITGNSLQMWTDSDTVDNFREVIWRKTRVSPCSVQKWLNGDINELDILYIAFEVFKTFGFIDDTAQRTCRPGSGPEPGGSIHAARRKFARMIQQAFYSGYMKCHGLKYQTVLLPNGIWACVYGAALRHNDKGVLNMSGLVELLQSLLVPIQGLGYPGLYGDNIFPSMYNVIFLSIEDPQTEEQKIFN